MRKLRVGIVGCGFVAKYHINAWRRNNAEVLAVCDIKSDVAKSIYIQLGRCFPKNIEELINYRNLLAKVLDKLIPLGVFLLLICKR